MAATHEKERQLTREIAPKVEGALPGTEVLAVELTSPDRFTVFVDHVGGVDHARSAGVIVHQATPDVGYRHRGFQVESDGTSASDCAAPGVASTMSGGALVRSSSTNPAMRLESA